MHEWIQDGCARTIDDIKKVLATAEDTRTTSADATAAIARLQDTLDEAARMVHKIEQLQTNTTDRITHLETTAEAAQESAVGTTRTVEQLQTAAAASMALIKARLDNSQETTVTEAKRVLDFIRNGTQDPSIRELLSKVDGLYQLLKPAAGADPSTFSSYQSE